MVVRVYVARSSAFCVRGARRLPRRRSAVAIIQRFGGALNHIHAMVIDGVFTDEARGRAFIRRVASRVTM
jgi:hypothetical protein